MMISKFDWCVRTVITDDEKKKIENSISQDFKARGDMELKPCHEGQIKVQLNIIGPLPSTLVGNLECSCGKKYCVFTGSSDASKITFNHVE